MRRASLTNASPPPSSPQSPNAPQSSHFKQVILGAPLKLDTYKSIREDELAQLSAINKERAQREAETVLQQTALQQEALLEETRHQCEALLAEARAEGERLIAEAQTQVDAFRAEGFAEGRQALELDALTTLESLEALSNEGFALKKSALQAFKPDAIGILKHVLHTLIGLQLDTDAEPFLEALLQKAIESLHLTGAVRVVIHPKLQENIASFSKGLEEAFDGLQSLSFETDSGLLENQILVMGTKGVFDISPDQQVRRLLEPIEAMLPDVETFLGSS
jgi:flagellar biosynthesis/type III secretory pathway protein FliH